MPAQNGSKVCRLDRPLLRSPRRRRQQRGRSLQPEKAHGEGFIGGGQMEK